MVNPGFYDEFSGWTFSDYSVQPHYAAIVYACKDDGFGNNVKQSPDECSFVFNLITENLH